jgi:hypothetical protein
MKVNKVSRSARRYLGRRERNGERRSKQINIQNPFRSAISEEPYDTHLELSSVNLLST